MRPHLLLLVGVMLLGLAGPGSAKTGEVSEVEFRLIKATGQLRTQLPGHFNSYPKGPKPVSHTARLLESTYGEDLLGAYAAYLKLSENSQKSQKSSENKLVSQLELQHDWDGPLTDEQSAWLADLVATTSEIPAVLPSCPTTDDDCQEAQYTLTRVIEQFQTLSNALKSRHDPS